MPYVVVGYIQVVLILVVSALVFQLPVRGSIVLLLVALGLFIAGNLALGITFSTVSENLMQAIQFAQFTLLPSIFLSGFMFPFKGMPVWAQWAGEVFPTTHARLTAQSKRAARNPELWPIALLTLVVVIVAIRFYRETLD